MIILDIYLMIGQSNMAGRAPLGGYGKKIHGAFLLNGNDVFEPARDSFNRYSTVKKEDMGDNLNPGYSFAKRMLEVYPNSRIGLVSNARGGTAIAEWEKGGLLYNEAVRRSKAAMRYGEMKGVLWHQGESDCGEASVLSQYVEQLIILVNNIRADLGNETIPFIVGQIAASTDKKAQFNDLMSGISERISYSACVSSAGLTDMGDGIHFDTAAQITLGQRYADKILQIQN